ncbi:MAG TPA: hypothetical protein VI997_12680 [Candidatus Thermoplasmatota archaeon]|nr:hypothetical protein [Candidatus Thermoplasmatota archaeon]
MVEAHPAYWSPPPKSVKSPVPRLTTLWAIERILHDAWERDDGPLSLEEIKRRMGSKGVRHATVRTCVDELARQGKAAATPSGVMWTLASPAWEKYVRSRAWNSL